MFNGKGFTPADDGKWFVATVDGLTVEGRLEFVEPDRSVLWFNRTPRPYGLADPVDVTPHDVEPMLGGSMPNLNFYVFTADTRSFSVVAADFYEAVKSATTASPTAVYAGLSGSLPGVHTHALRRQPHERA